MLGSGANKCLKEISIHQSITSTISRAVRSAYLSYGFGRVTDWCFYTSNFSTLALAHHYPLRNYSHTPVQPAMSDQVDSTFPDGRAQNELDTVVHK